MAAMTSRVVANRYKPPAPWLSLMFRMRGECPRREPSPTQKWCAISSLTDAEFAWLGRVWLADAQRRAAGEVARQREVQRAG